MPNTHTRRITGGLALLVALAVAAPLGGQEWKGEENQPALALYARDGRLTVEPQVQAGWVYKSQYVGTASGRYLVIVNAVEPDGKTLHLYKYILTLPGSAPVPPEPPTPDPQPIPPTPKPTPTAKVAYVLVIEESSDRILNPRFAQLWDSKPLRDKLTAAKIKLRIVDDDAVDEDGKPDPRAKSWCDVVKDRPGVVLFDTNGKVVHVGKAPESIEALTKLVNENGGGL